MQVCICVNVHVISSVSYFTREHILQLASLFVGVCACGVVYCQFRSVVSCKSKVCVWFTHLADNFVEVILCFLDSLFVRLVITIHVY